MPVRGWLIDAGGRQFPLDETLSLQIGRDPGNSIVLNDVSVSRTHAEIFFQGGSARVRDLGSANGTFVDGTSVRDSALYDRQSVRIGSVGFTYRSATSAQQQTIVIGDQRTAPAMPLRTMAQPLPGIFCQSCGSSNKTGAAFCTKCGSPLRAIRQAEVQSVYAGSQVQYIATSTVNAGLAAVLSFFWCGLGHIYAGKIGKGLLMMFLYPCFLACGYLFFFGGLVAVGNNNLAGAFFSLLGLAFLVCALIVWVYGMVNSYNIAKHASVATISRVQVTPF
jgi:TM2 domain-containing membrane protein YozV